MNFTPTPPTEPGVFYWKYPRDDEPTVVVPIKRAEIPIVVVLERIDDRLMATVPSGFWGQSPTALQGEWCRLVPEKPKCIWTKRPHDTLFKTACGVHKFLDPGSNEPASNFYCSNCGGEIEVK